MNIADVVMNRINRDYVLPSIQREFVWLKNPKEQKIEKLFDSIMQEYPFGTILAWRVKKELKKTRIHWEIYNFVQKYDTENPHNIVGKLNGYSIVYLILDGQQRLTSLYLGLTGHYSTLSHTKKHTYTLYLNLVSDIEYDQDNDYGMKYDFQFIEKPKNDATHLWYEVGKILDYHNKKFTDLLNDYESVVKGIITDPGKIQQARDTLSLLHLRICGDSNVLEVKEISIEDDDEKVLNIFVRTNDGGIKLEKSNLLLSYMEYDRNLFQPLGARKEITQFTDELNSESLHQPKYNFRIDDVLKATLVLSDIEVQYKLKNFNTDNLLRISDSWESIKKYLGMTRDLVAKYGFASKNIVSYNSLIPIAYYLQIMNKKSSFVPSTTITDIEEKNEIVRWFVISQLSGSFGGSSDTTLKVVRDLLNQGKKFNQINLGKTIERDDIEKWVETERYNSRYSHLLLMLLSETKYWDDCHQDHIFPISKFNPQQYNALKLKKGQKEYYDKYANSLYNLHLLNPSVNIKKSADDFIDWAAKQNKAFLKSSLIPTNVGLTFTEFEQFSEERKKCIIEKLCEILI